MISEVPFPAPTPRRQRYWRDPEGLPCRKAGPGEMSLRPPVLHSGFPAFPLPAIQWNLYFLETL